MGQSETEWGSGTRRLGFWAAKTLADQYMIRSVAQSGMALVSVAPRPGAAACVGGPHRNAKSTSHSPTFFSVLWEVNASAEDPCRAQ
eukprot:62163-Pleurochrysis_carterae.AAC.1